MKNAEMTYGALSAKIRALYGKRLRLADYQHMAGGRLCPAGRAEK